MDITPLCCLLLFLKILTCLAERCEYDSAVTEQAAQDNGFDLCPCPPTVANGGLISKLADFPEHGAIFTTRTNFVVKCNPGFRRLGNARISCRTGQWTLPGQCQRSDLANNKKPSQPDNEVCGQLPGIANAIVMIQGKQPGAGSFVTYSCHQGFFSSDATFAVCLNNGTWKVSGNCRLGTNEQPITTTTAITSNTVPSQCNESPPTIPNGVLTRWKSDNMFLISCQQGYMNIGYNIIACVTQWTVGGRCVKKEKEVNYCPPLPVNATWLNGVFTEIDNANKNMVKLECYPGYKIINSGVAFCKPNALFSTLGKCVKESDVQPGSLSCPNPPRDVNNAKLTIFQEGEPNLIVVCNDGYTINGPNSVTCSVTGRWIKAAKCVSFGDVVQLNNTEAVTCPDLPVIPNGALSGKLNDRSVSTLLSIHCDSGYELSGLGLVQCSNTGKWVTKGKCHRTNLATSTPCPAPPLVENGELTGQVYSREEGALIIVNCNVGYDISGVNVIICTGGKWSVPPRCRLSTTSTSTSTGTPSPKGWCQTPSTVLNADVRGRISPTYNLGENVTITCHEGYSLVGQGYSKCLTTGSWSPHGECRPIEPLSFLEIFSIIFAVIVVTGVIAIIIVCCVLQIN